MKSSTDVPKNASNNISTKAVLVIKKLNQVKLNSFYAKTNKEIPKGSESDHQTYSSLRKKSLISPGLVF